MNPLDLIATARDLSAVSSRGRPRQSNLRRIISTTYYALFHCLATCCADMLVGGAGANRSRPAWNQTYRALQHGTARQRCHQQNIARFPDEIRYFARVFVDMQLERHRADYDPDVAFAKADVIQYTNVAEDAIQTFLNAPVRDRRAFAIYVLLPVRGA